MRPMPLAFAATLVLGLAACNSTPTPEAPPPPEPETPSAATPAATPSAATPAATPPPMASECTATGAQKFVGQEASPDAIEAARLAAGAATVRTIKPNQPVTMDYRGDRLNLRIDDNSMITGASCG
jgi:hypothetical protein